MKTLKSILAAIAMTAVATAGAQTLKMSHQTSGVTTYEASSLTRDRTWAPCIGSLES